MESPDPVLQTVKIEDLRPTQMTVGLREVGEKRRQWKERVSKDGPKFLGSHVAPVVKGPKGRFYVLDHHHLARALADEGVQSLGVTVAADLSALARDEFWIFCDNRGWCHPYDAEGKRRAFVDIPKSIGGLQDDPYRSLAGELRRAGGYAKDPTPFAEFLWADFLRRRLKLEIVRNDFASALTKALKLGRSGLARHLPGWCGPSPES